MSQPPQAIVESGPPALNGRAIHRLIFAGTVIRRRIGGEPVRAELDALAGAINRPIDAWTEELLLAAADEIERRKAAEEALRVARGAIDPADPGSADSAYQHAALAITRLILADDA